MYSKKVQALCTARAVHAENYHVSMIARAWHDLTAMAHENTSTLYTTATQVHLASYLQVGLG